MSKILSFLTIGIAFALGFLSHGNVAQSASGTAKVYQVTGPVLEASDSKIIVQKGDEKWEIIRDASTKVLGEVKSGAKVTVQYRMMATSIEQKK